MSRRPLSAVSSERPPERKPFRQAAPIRTSEVIVDEEQEAIAQRAAEAAGLKFETPTSMAHNFTRDDWDRKRKEDEEFERERAEARKKAEEEGESATL